MTSYVVRIDEKGRILLPKEIRKSFKSSATIAWESQTSCGKIYPSNPRVVTVEVDVTFEPDEATMKFVWKHEVALLYLGICPENGWYTIRLIGKEDDVRRVLLTWGWDDEEAKDLIEEGDPK